MSMLTPLTPAPSLNPNLGSLFRLHNDMNRLFETFFEDMPAARGYGMAYPALNLWEENDHACLEAELAGMTLADIEVSVQGNEVSITGQRQLPQQENATWHRRERAQGRFYRSVTLPWEIDADKVEARLTDGILSLRLPKSPSARAHKVKVVGS